MRKILTPTAFIVALAMSTVACGPAPEDPPADIEVVGEWDEQFVDEPTVITATTWGASTIVNYDNDANWVVVQMSADDEWNPGKFAKFVWTDIAGDAFFYCWVDFGLDTAAEAESTTKTADAKNPAETGCGGEFPWTKMTAHKADG